MEYAPYLVGTYWVAQYHYWANHPCTCVTSSTAKWINPICREANSVYFPGVLTPHLNPTMASATWSNHPVVHLTPDATTFTAGEDPDAEDKKA